MSYTVMEMIWDCPRVIIISRFDCHVFNIGCITEVAVKRGTLVLLLEPFNGGANHYNVLLFKYHSPIYKTTTITLRLTTT